MGLPLVKVANILYVSILGPGGLVLNLNLRNELTVSRGFESLKFVIKLYVIGCYCDRHTNSCCSGKTDQLSRSSCGSASGDLNFGFTRMYRLRINQILCIFFAISEYF